ncbi:MAG: alkaline phosphatase family protein [Acidimicrobiales bacterium]|nr:alkaline phosphatase family protein [Acidimicrobiales bacterium]
MNRPAGNVLFITVDQWRGDCLSAAGHPVVRTPTLDALAARGVRFANHWSVTAPCGPSRASLLTGLYLMNHRSVDNGTPLDDRFDNIARIARRAGYDPTLFGYTDTTVDPRTVSDPSDPRLRDYEGVLPGFTVGTLLTGAGQEPWLRWLAENGIDVPSNPKRLFDPIPGYPGSDDHAPSWAPGLVPAHLTETAFLTRQVCDWLDRRDGDPWFAHVSYLRPHPPYRAPEGYHDRYDADDGEPFHRLPDRDTETAMHPLHAGAVHVTGCPIDEREARQVRATYWGNMSEVDDQLGVLLDHLDVTGHGRDTLVVLTSDHGDQMGDHWLIEKLGWWDESFHVPLIVVDPRRTADGTRGTTVDAFTESVDVLPTICEWIGSEVPVEADGRSLRSFLEGEGAPANWRGAAHWQWDFRDPVRHVVEDLFGLTMEQCCLDVVRTHTEKYVHFGDGSSLYFDLRDDPYGLRDLAGDPQSAEARLSLLGDLLTWRQRHDDRNLTGHKVTTDGLVVRRDERI